MRVGEGLIQLDVPCLEHQPSAARHRVPGVDGQIEDHLLQLHRVGTNESQVAIGIDRKLDVLSDQSTQHALEAHDDLIQIQRPRHQHLPAAEGEELSSERRSPLRRHPDLLDIAPHRFGECGVT